MHSTPLRRALAVVLVFQPVFWMSDVALAQAVQQPFLLPTPSGGPVAPAEIPFLRTDGPVVVAPATPPVDEPVDPDKDVCGAGDVFELNFWGVQNFKLRVTVDLEGRAFVSKVGYLSLQGRTLTDARRLMREQVTRFNPGAAAAKTTYRDFRAGDVRHSLADVSKARRLLGYDPRVRVRQGLERSAE